jgi:hypothetical protein
MESSGVEDTAPEHVLSLDGGAALKRGHMPSHRLGM